MSELGSPRSLTSADSSNFIDLTSSESSSTESDYQTGSHGSAVISNIVEPATSLHLVKMTSLRIHDNTALSVAMSNGLRFKALFIYDPWFETGEQFGLNRWKFLIESLNDLDMSLQSYGSRLLVAKGQPLVVLEKLCQKWNVKSITYQVDKDVGSDQLERSIDSLSEKLGITVSKFEGHTLYDTEKLLPPQTKEVLTIKDFKTLLGKTGLPNKPVDPPPKNPNLLADLSQPPEFRIPTLEDVGFTENDIARASNYWVGGESVALSKITQYVSTRSKLSWLSPELLMDKSSLSPYIRFGCLSVRYLFWKVKELAEKDPSYKDFHQLFVSGILNREFFFVVSMQVRNFDCYADNRLCLRLPWHNDTENTEMLRLWKQGKTGFPWIDAGMRQLWQEGWIHHTIRECVAIFLTRGELWLSWELGRKVFSELLLDYEASVSSGCWMKSSGSAFLSGPMEYYCPVTFGYEIDPTGKYIRHYIPELRDFPNEYIYAPWMAPVSAQVKASCRIGVDYPLPILNHVTTGALCHFRVDTIMSVIHTINSSSKAASEQDLVSET